MCVTSAVGDYWRDRQPREFPWVMPPNPIPATWTPPNAPTREEFEALKKSVEELKKLLEAAKRFDEATGQPDCEMEQKVVLIKKLAEMVGVDLGDVFGGGAA